MRSLNLRTRLLVGIGCIAVLQIVIALVVVNATRDQLTDQIDDRLTVAATPERTEGFDREGIHGGPDRVGAPATAPDRLSDTYEGVLQADGTLLTFFPPNSTGIELAPPAIDPATARESIGRPITVDATGADLEYRAIATDSGRGELFITAIPLDGVNATVADLRTVVALTVAAITLALALVTWWVLRLGIAPIKRMTATAEAIAAGDLSERIADADPRTEAGQLGHALNTMLGRIETSFEQRTKAEEKLRHFIADASHELRTPVATIRGYAELYRFGGLEDPAELDDAMRRTEQESQRMSRLIADMLNLAKLDRDPTIAARPVSLTSLAQDTLADARATHPERTIETDIATEDLVVEGDEDLLRQVFANITTNAILHTGPTATVTVTTRRFDDRAVVTIADDGDGMAADVVARVTERFYRADPSRSRHKGGSGLGLSIADSVVTAHGGTLGVDSSPGKGTVVTISLPLAP